MGMTEWHGPELPRPADDDHLLTPMHRWLRDDPGRTMYSYRAGDTFVEVPVRDAWNQIVQYAQGLVACGVEPGDRVALMAHTRFEWLLVDLAIVAAGAVTVPIYDTSSAEQVEWIVGDSGSVALLVETPAMRKQFEEVAGRLPLCREVFTIDEGGLADLADRGADVDATVIDERIAGLRGDAVATIIYTSGTTGRPKGCVITHGNLRTNVAQSLDAVRDMFGPDEQGLLFLPMAHSLTKINVLFALDFGIPGAFATDIAHLPEELALVQPTVLAAVPRIFEKVYNGARQKARAERKGPIFDRAAGVAVRWSQERHNGRVRPWTAAEHWLFDRLVYGKIGHATGGKLRLAVSGGAPLGERLTYFFDGIGLRIFEGYGLTETSPLLTINRVGAWKPGTVGQPVGGTAIRIADDGEILAKGPQVFQGYWNNPEATAEVFEDGWFCTGDIGELDDEGYLRITGRKKDLIVTAAGKNVAPAPLEDRLRAHALVSQAVVVGDGRPFVSALVTLDPDALAAWAETEGLGALPAADLAASPEVRAAVQKAIDDANLSVSRAESIRAFAVLPNDFTIDSGELTPTLKVKRQVVEQRYAEVIERLYKG